MHELSASFVLGYHGCDSEVVPSQNDYDWLGSGIYFWEANSLRGLEFAEECSQRDPSLVPNPTFVGAVIDLGYCLDLTTSRGLKLTTQPYSEFHQAFNRAGLEMPRNHADGVRNHLDCAVVNYVHLLQSQRGNPPFDSVKGVFIERPPFYPGSAFGIKNHSQIANRNQACIKGVFRVPVQHLAPTT